MPDSHWIFEFGSKLFRSPYFYLFISVCIICFGHYKVCSEIAKEYKNGNKIPGSTFLDHKTTAFECLGCAITLCYTIFKRAFKIVTTLYLSITGTSKYIFDKDSPLTLDNYSRLKIIFLGVAGITVPLYIAGSTYKTVYSFSNGGISAHITASAVSAIMFTIIYICDRAILSFPAGIYTYNAKSIIQCISNGKSIYTANFPGWRSPSTIFGVSRLLLALSTSSILITLTYVTVYSEDIVKEHRQKIEDAHSASKITALLNESINLFKEFEIATNAYLTQAQEWHISSSKSNALEIEIKNPSLYSKVITVDCADSKKQVEEEYKSLLGKKLPITLDNTIDLAFENVITERTPKKEIKALGNKRRAEISNFATKFKSQERDNRKKREESYSKSITTRDKLMELKIYTLYSTWQISPKSLPDEIKKVIQSTANNQTDLHPKAKKDNDISVLQAISFIPVHLKKLYNDSGEFIYKLISGLPLMTILVLYELLPIISKICFPPSSYETAIAFQSILTSLSCDINITKDDAEKIYNAADERNMQSRGLLYDSIAKLSEFEVMQKNKDAELATALDNFKNAFSTYVQFLSIYPWASTFLALIIFFSLGSWFLSILGIQPPWSELFTIPSEVGKT